MLGLLDLVCFGSGVEDCYGFMAADVVLLLNRGLGLVCDGVRTD